MRRGVLAIAAGVLLCLAVQPVIAQKKYGPGVTDTEIKIGQTMPYSGGASAISLMGRVESAYFKMINAKGGVNGRKINFLSRDDGFSPPKTVEHTRALVEGDEVLAIVGSLGSGPNLAIAKYLNSAKVPQILVSAGSPKLLAPELPWTTIFINTVSLEARYYAAYILKANPDAKIGILYSNDETGKTYLEGFRSGLGSKAVTMIVKEVGVDLSYPTIDSQILQLQASGADTIFFSVVSPKFGAQGIRKIGELGWKPQMLLNATLSAVDNVLKPAGAEYAAGAITSMFYKVPGDPLWEKDQGMQDYFAFMKEYAPSEPANDYLAVLGYLTAQITVDILKRCGDDLTRENLLDKATHIKDFEPTLFIPGVKVNVTPDDREPWKHARMAKFDGKNWVLFGDIITAPSLASLK